MVGEDTFDEEKIVLIDPQEGNKTHAFLQLNSVVNLENSKLTIGSPGVLMKHLQLIQQEQGMIGEEMEGEDEGTETAQPLSIRSFSCEMCMHVNSDTIKSLCIFDHETHPNMHQKHAKESLSLFGLLDKTSSVLGKYMLYEWVSKPTRDKSILDYRHDAISFFLQDSVKDSIHELCSSLRHIKNFHRILAKVKECKATSNDWQNILKFAYYTTRVLALLNQLYKCGGAEVEFMKKVIRQMSVVESMKVIQSVITNIIDFEASKAEGRIIVKDGVDSELDHLRKKYESLDNYLLQKSLEISAALPVELGSTLNLVYFPQLGYLVTLPQYHHQRSKIADGSRTSASSSHVSDYYARCLAGFELQFTTMDNLYYKNEVTRELDENIGDIHAMIADKEVEIIQELSRYVLEHADQLSETVQVLSELDCILSLAMVAHRFNYTKPTMTLDDSLFISQGRHPLQELCVDIFIPNDTFIKGGQGFKSSRNNANNDKDQLSCLFDRTSSCTSYRHTTPENNTFCNSTSASTIYPKNGKRKFDMLDTITENSSQIKGDVPLFEKQEDVVSTMPINTGDADIDASNIRPATSTSIANRSSTIPINRSEASEGNVDEYMKEELNSVQVVTGANFSGKSVYLKQIALIVYMAHIGSFVPASQAEIGITDKLFTRIKTTETVSQPQSAFAFDLQQLQRALNNSTNHSLIIIDEFGKGTDSCDGAALFCAVIGYYLSKGDQCPKIVASTHFHDVISQNILSKEDGITLSQTEIMCNSVENKEEGDEVVFLYRIVPGKEATASYGIWCASIAGLPLPTIKRAISLSETYVEGKLIERTKTEEEQEKYKQLEAIRDDFLSSDATLMDPQGLITSIQDLFKTK